MDRDKVRLGVIGAGWWVTVNHLPLLAQRDDVELMAVCCLGADVLRAVKDHFGFAHATEDYRELLELDLDGVIVGSPHTLHYEHARAALEREMHVLCEKPMTLRPDEAWTLVELARERGVELLVPYGWHYTPFIEEVKRLMEEGAVGRVEYALCHMASPTKDFFAGAGRCRRSGSRRSPRRTVRRGRSRRRGAGTAMGRSRM